LFQRYVYLLASLLQNYLNPLPRYDNKKEPDDNIYCHQAPGYTAKIVKTIPYSIHIEKNNQEQYFDYPKKLKSHNINRKQIGFMKSTGCL